MSSAHVDIDVWLKLIVYVVAGLSDLSKWCCDFVIFQSVAYETILIRRHIIYEFAPENVSGILALAAIALQ